ncbi:hypothetical protein LIA77_01445 [Sarocladium implicatum]|nr:hypothetical protein LIA77_01445 [Sarocladium implicatum]
MTTTTTITTTTARRKSWRTPSLSQQIPSFSNSATLSQNNPNKAGKHHAGSSIASAHLPIPANLAHGRGLLVPGAIPRVAPWGWVMPRHTCITPDIARLAPLDTLLWRSFVVTLIFPDRVLNQAAKGGSLGPSAASNGVLWRGLGRRRIMAIS